MIYVDRAKLARLIRDKRGERSLRDVQNDAGVSYASLSYFENERRSPTLESLVRIAHWLEVPVEELVLES